VKDQRVRLAHPMISTRLSNSIQQSS
jgi:hypothetical protein